MIDQQTLNVVYEELSITLDEVIPDDYTLRFVTSYITDTHKFTLGIMRKMAERLGEDDAIGSLVKRSIQNPDLNDSCQLYNHIANACKRITLA